MEFAPEQHKRFTVGNFSKIMPIYEEIIDKNGKKVLKHTEDTNIYEQIQEHKDSVLLSNLIEKYQLDPEELPKALVSDEVIDITSIPTNPVDAYVYIENAKNIWNKLGNKLQEQFNNDFTQFLQGAENGTLEKMIKGSKEEVESTQPIENVNEIEKPAETPNTGVKYE